MKSNEFKTSQLSKNTYRMTVTPQLATKWIVSNYGKNRRIDDGVVRFYADQMKRGLWRFNGDTIKIDTEGCIQDGQHRLKACILADTPFDTLVVIDVPVESYITQNTGKPQQAGDVMRLNGVVNYVGTASAARAYIKLAGGETSSITNRRISNQEVWSEYESKKELYDYAVREARRFYQRNKAVKTSDTAAAIVYLVCNKGFCVEFASEFFDRVSDYSDTSNATCNAMRDFLRRHASTGSRRDEAVVRKAWAYSFNKWSKDEEVVRIPGMNSSTIRDWRDVRSCFFA